MAKYTVRIELHDADEKDYVDLHAAMEKAGFVRWIEGDSGNRYQLPTAEYNLTGTALDGEKVKNLALKVANSIKPKPAPWVLVTKSVERRWSNLERW